MKPRVYNDLQSFVLVLYTLLRTWLSPSLSHLYSPVTQVRAPFSYPLIPPPSSALFSPIALTTHYTTLSQHCCQLLQRTGNGATTLPVVKPAPPHVLMWTCWICSSISHLFRTWPYPTRSVRHCYPYNKAFVVWILQPCTTYKSSRTKQHSRINLFYNKDYMSETSLGYMLRPFPKKGWLLKCKLVLLSKGEKLPPSMFISWITSWHDRNGWISVIFLWISKRNLLEFYFISYVLKYSPSLTLKRFSPESFLHSPLWR